MDRIIVLDFGSQYSHLICRRIREGNIFCELLPYNLSIHEIKKLNPKGIILSGGPSSVYSKDSPRPDRQIFSSGIPILGICYGHQLLVDEFEGRINRAAKREYGYADLIVDDSSDLFKGVGSGLKCWMSHADAAEDLPKGFQVLAHTQSSHYAAIANREQRLYGIQFHPEVSHTENGSKILKNFSNTISQASPEWNMEDFITRSVKEIKELIRDEKVLCAVSGGIDSTTLAVLLNRSIPPNLVCIFVDNGLLREGEDRLIPSILVKKMGLNLVCLDRREQFLGRLRGVEDPEAKRKIVGEEFAKVFVEFSDTEGPFQWLAQGTLYPDVIESGISKGPAATIKTHHNVGGLPKWLGMKVLEPFRTLYKDEVRKVASLLGIPNDFLTRHPFPGPGLAVRTIGKITDQKITIVRQASSIVEEELKKANWYNKVWQAFAAVGDDRAVGVLGDERVYGHVVTIRVVESSDAMTADWSRLPFEILQTISSRITNEVEGVTWVTYAISSKPPATIEPQ